MHCSGSFEIGFFGAAYFAGLLVASFIFPPMGDIYGRRVFVLVSNYIQAACFLVFLFASNVYIYYVTIFITGISCTLKIIGYSYFLEILPGRESFYGGILYFTEGFILIITPVILFYVTKNLQYFIFFCFLVNFVACIVFLVCYLPESVKFTLEKGRHEKAEKDIEYICRINKTSEEEKQKVMTVLKKYLSDLKEMNRSCNVNNSKINTNKHNKESLFGRLKGDRKSMLNLFLMIQCWIVSAFTFYLICFFVKYMPGDIYVNQSVSNLSAIFYLFTGTFTKWLGVKRA
jgi:MFS family permease